MPVDPFDIPHLYTDSSRRVEQHEHGTEWEETVGAQNGLQAPRAVRLLYDTRTLRWMTAVLALLFGILTVRLFLLQGAEGAQLRNAADENRFRVLVEPAARGVVYDADRDVLARNIPVYQIAAIPVDLPAKDSDAHRTLTAHLAEYLGLPETDLIDKLATLDLRSYQPATIVDDIDREAALRVRANTLELPGIDVQYRARREYVGGADFAHLLGYVGRISQEEYDDADAKDSFYLLDDVIGKSGLEAQYEDPLRGTYGRRQVEVDSLGTLKSVVAEQAALPGASLVLSIDKDFQAFTRERLQGAMQAAGSKAGSVVALDPRTGDVLAMVSLPSYDPNLFARGISQEAYRALLADEGRPLFNRAVVGTYPPGSTIKPVVAATALEEGVITSSTTVVDRGSIQVQHEYNPAITYLFVGWNRAGLGTMNLFSAIAKSSDIYFYAVSGGYGDIAGLGRERLAAGFRKFGLGSRLGIDLPAEAPGLVPTEDWKIAHKGETWYKGDTYHMGIGQGDLLATPLQAASWTATIANGGTLYKPRLVRKLYDSQTKETRELQPSILSRHIVCSETAQLVQQAMRQTVLYWSGRELNRLSFSSAGKTGTAQYAGNKKEHAWYVGYAPYEDPKIAIAVLVEGGGGGDVVSVPVAGDVMQWYLQRQK